MNVPTIMKVLTVMTFRVLCVLMLCFGLSVRSVSQEPVVREQTAGNVISFEHQVIREDSTIRVIIPFRIRYDFFVFIKPLASASSAFTGGGEVSAELLDSTGTSVARTIERVNLSVNDNTPPELRSHFFQNFISFTVPAGKYSVVFSLEDKESRRRYSDARRTFRIPARMDSIPGLIPVKKTGDRQFVLYNLSGDVQFSQDYGFLFQAQRSYTSAVYTLRKILPDEDDFETVVANAPVSVVPFVHTTCIPLKDGNSIELTLKEGSVHTLHYVGINGSLLRQGRYELTLTFPDSTTVRTSFGARWLEMPASLSDLDVAIEPLQFIMTKNDYSELRRGGRDARIRKFEEFWKKKDTTPATAYNEVMHEFYRRVDFAFTAFRTLREMNGAVTDRGRIYLLYGNPTTTERQLSPDGAPKEIWKYNSLNKIFTFEDPSKQGNYKLAEH